MAAAQDDSETLRLEVDTMDIAQRVKQLRKLGEIAEHGDEQVEATGLIWLASDLLRVAG